MKNITVVTTFHQPGLEKYGQRFIDSFSNHVDKKIKMLVYAENCMPNNPDSKQITVINSEDALIKLLTFKEKWKDDPKANGVCPFPERRKLDYHKAFKWDAVRFANKVYAVFDACNRVNQDWVVWMDADTVVHNNWSYEEFDNLLPNKCWITYVGRGKSSQSWPECGFYGLNLNSIICVEFLKEFERMYENAENGIFKLDEWHDSYVFGHLLKKYKRYHNNVFDYTSNIEIKGAKTGGGGHPLINTELGKWIDHMKGERKNLGKSKITDLIVDRKEGYWK